MQAICKNISRSLSAKSSKLIFNGHQSFSFSFPPPKSWHVSTLIKLLPIIWKSVWYKAKNPWPQNSMVVHHKCWPPPLQSWQMHMKVLIPQKPCGKRVPMLVRDEGIPFQPSHVHVQHSWNLADYALSRDYFTTICIEAIHFYT